MSLRRHIPSLITLLAGLLVVIVAAAFAFEEATEGPASANSSTSDATTVDTSTLDGAELYATQCVSCHGVAGEGKAERGPSLLEEGPAAVDFVLRTGRMPAANPHEQATRSPVRYTEAEIVALVDFVGALGNGPAIPDVTVEGADVANGGALFRLNCAACHVASGAGSVIGSDRRAPSLADATPTVVGEAIVVGPGAMPVFASLTDQEINDIAAYVEVLQDDGAAGIRSLGGVGPVAEGLAAWILGLAPLIALTRWMGRGRTNEVAPAVTHTEPEASA